MANPPEQKDFLRWLQEDLVPMVNAAGVALEPRLLEWQQMSITFHGALTNFVEKHRESIELWLTFAQIYPQLKPYLENIEKSLNDPDYEVANDVVDIVHIFESIDLQKDAKAASLLSVISSDPFQGSLIDLYKNSQLSSKRIDLIKEALCLHNQHYFGGSICLLYSLIEGVLTESFEKANYIVVHSNKTHPVNIKLRVVKKQNLSGLEQKLNHAISCEDQLKHFYSKIKAYELVNGDPSQTIPKTRNKILHGNEMNFNTEKRSGQLILWLYSVLLHIQVLSFNEAK